MVDVIVGRDIDEIEKFGKEGTIFLGKEYIRIGYTMSLANKVYLDVNYPHLILVCGKRGSGKSYTLGSIVESIAKLDEKVRKKVSILIFDTMGIFWTMRFPNLRDIDLLEAWGMKPEPVRNLRIFVPKKFIEEYEKMIIPFDFTFSIDPSELNPEEWLYLFNLKPLSLIGSYLKELIIKARERLGKFNLEDLESELEKSDFDPKVKRIIKSLLDSARSWEIFDKKSYDIKFLIEPGNINVLDLSMYTFISKGWSLKNTIIGYISRKIFEKRILFRKKEEVLLAERGETKMGEEFPIVWLVIDEAHEVLPKDKETPATEPLVQIIREGRQPGISLLLATQQPGKIHTDVITQSDIVIAHRVTAREDIEALNNIMRHFSSQDIEKLMNLNLPKRKGSALLLDDKSERIIPIQVKPRISWHGGENPSLLG